MRSMGDWTPSKGMHLGPAGVGHGVPRRFLGRGKWEKSLWDSRGVRRRGGLMAVGPYGARWGRQKEEDGGITTRSELTLLRDKSGCIVGTRRVSSLSASGSSAGGRSLNGRGERRRGKGGGRGRERELTDRSRLKAGGKAVVSSGSDAPVRRRAEGLARRRKTKWVRGETRRRSRRTLPMPKSHIPRRD